jgi:hypothetical protein
LLISDDDGRTTSICFGPEAKQLPERILDEKLMERAAHQIGFMLEKSEMLYSGTLSKRCCVNLDMDVVERSWRGVGAIIDLILEGSLRLIGPAFKGGVIVEHLTRSTPDGKVYVWFSLGYETDEEPIMVDLSEPLNFERGCRFPIKADEQLFITLGFRK